MCVCVFVNVCVYMSGVCVVCVCKRVCLNAVLGVSCVFVNVCV